MKKIAIITASIIIFTILAGFNYLLWDNIRKNEKLQESETIRVENQDSIASLLDVINDKNNTIEEIRQQRTDLQSIINEFDETENVYTEEIASMGTEIQNFHETIVIKNIIINALKETIDDEYFKDFLSRKWANNINTKNYFLAYTYQNSRLILGDTNEISVVAFEEQYKNIVSIEVVSAIMDEIKQDNDTQIDVLQFIVSLNVVLKKDENQLPLEDLYFIEGENVFTFTFDYDLIRSTWIIIGMN